MINHLVRVAMSIDVPKHRRCFALRDRAVNRLTYQPIGEQSRSYPTAIAALPRKPRPRSQSLNLSADRGAIALITHPQPRLLRTDRRRAGGAESSASHKGAASATHASATAIGATATSSQTATATPSGSRIPYIITAKRHYFANRYRDDFANLRPCRLGESECTTLYVQNSFLGEFCT